MANHIVDSVRQSQASWFVVTGENFVIDGHNTGGIDGNGQVLLPSDLFSISPENQQVNLPSLLMC